MKKYLGIICFFCFLFCWNDVTLRGVMFYLDSTLQIILALFDQILVFRLSQFIMNNCFSFTRCCWFLNIWSRLDCTFNMRTMCSNWFITLHGLSMGLLLLILLHVALMLLLLHRHCLLLLLLYQLLLCLLVCHIPSLCVQYPVLRLLLVFLHFLIQLRHSRHLLTH
uniref:Uncharacterized protein n=1 Tax=Cacopsylla melanoneura TaxID=428564 RepID=A0A8D8Z3C3_9HEMI